MVEGCKPMIVCTESGCCKRVVSSSCGEIVPFSMVTSCAPLDSSKTKTSPPISTYGPAEYCWIAGEGCGEGMVLLDDVTSIEALRSSNEVPRHQIGSSSVTVKKSG